MRRLFLAAALCGRFFPAPALLAAGSVRPPVVAPAPPAALGPIQAVVLDMDGVVTPASGALWALHGQEYLRSVAPAWAEGDLAHIKWKSLPEVHRWITENRGAVLGYEEYARRREAVAAYIYGELAELEPTFLETRDALKARGVSVALASANTRFSVDSMLGRFGLAGFFDATASLDEVDSALRRLGKSQAHLLALERLGIPPGRALAVEDTAAGLGAARQAGLHAAGLRNGFNDREDFSAAQLIIFELREILALPR